MDTYRKVLRFHPHPTMASSYTLVSILALLVVVRVESFFPGWQGSFASSNHNLKWGVAAAEVSSIDDTEDIKTEQRHLRFAGVGR